MEKMENGRSNLFLMLLAGFVAAGFLITLILFTLWKGSYQSSISTADSSLIGSNANAFNVNTFSIDGQDVDPEGILYFLPNQNLVIRASYQAVNHSDLNAPAFRLSFVTKFETRKVTAGGCRFNAMQTDGSSRTVIGIFKMPPEHMVGFMQQYTTKKYFDGELMDGERVVAKCRIGLKE